LPQARRFTDLGVTADAPLPALETVDSLARVPTPASVPVRTDATSSHASATDELVDVTDPSADVDSAASSTGDVRNT
jgi:hypothetical protein